MKVKNLTFLIVIFTLLFISVLNLNFNGINPQKNNLIYGDSYQNENDYLYPRISESSNLNRIDVAEQAARWLNNTWNTDNWNQTGKLYLGQRGVAGIGDFYIELYKATSNSSYLNWAENVATWMLANRPGEYSGTGKWPNILGSYVEVSNFTGYEDGVAGIGTFFLNLYDASSNAGLKANLLNEIQDIDTYLSTLEKTTVAGNASAWKEKDEIDISNVLSNPYTSKIIDGSTLSGTQLSYLNTFDSNYYQIANDTQDNTDVEYSFYLAGAGLPEADLKSMGFFIKRFSVNITVLSNISLTGSDILIQKRDNSWEVIDSDGIDTTESEYGITIWNNAHNYVVGGAVKIKVNTTANNPHRISINCLNITLDYANIYNSSSFSTGAAGIGTFYLRYYQTSSNINHLNTAKAAANFTIDQAIVQSGMAAWYEAGFYYSGIKKGVAGIGGYLLDLYQTTSINVYRNYAIDAADWLIDDSIYEEIGDGDQVGGNKTLRWTESNDTSNENDYLIGGDYCAGIGQFLLDIGLEVGGLNTYINSSVMTANLLTTQGFIVDLEEEFSYDVYYKWKIKDTAGDYDFTYSQGGSGALEFLNNLFLANQTSRYSKFLSGGLEWILKTLNITDMYWDDDRVTNNIQNGLAGVALALLHIDLLRPEILEDNVPTQLEYNAQLRVSFDIDNPHSDIQEVIIRYAYGSDYQLGVWTDDSLSSEGGGIYSYVFSPSQYLTYNTTLHYAIIAIDENESFSFDNNGYEYQLNVVDTIAPYTTLTQLFDGLGADESGDIKISILKESARGAALDKVDIDSASLGIADSIPDTIFTDEGTYLTYEYEITTPKNAKYGDSYNIDFTVYDEASNTRVVETTVDIADKFFPDINFTKYPYSKWIPQYTSVTLEAKAYDVGSGLDDETGVFVYYSIDDGNTWEMIYLEKKSGDKYSGTIPGQIMLAKIYYVLGAEDKEGNSIFIDKYGTTYEKFEDIELKDMEYYNIIINWPILLIIVGVIASIIIFGYLLYSKRGDYLTKMRRKSKATATGLAIKERFTNFYYKLYDNVNTLGEKLAKSKDSFATVGPWISDHFGERTRKFFWGIGRVLWAVPKAIGHAIGSFFRGAGALITKSKGYQIFLFMVFGLLILLTTVVQFIMEGAYPLRAVFFANLGFLMFITGVVMLLIRFIYKLTYK